MNSYGIWAINFPDNVSGIEWQRITCVVVFIYFFSFSSPTPPTSHPAILHHWSLLLCLYHSLCDGMSTLGNDDSSVGGWKGICQRVQISNCCHGYTLLCCLLEIPEKVPKECLELDFSIEFYTTHFSFSIKETDSINTANEFKLT